MAATSRKDRLKWLIARGHIPPEYEDLGERIIVLAERKTAEPSPHMHFDQGGGGGPGGSGPDVRVGARQRWERMFKVAGWKAEAVITAIIVEGKTTEEAAKALNVHPKAILPLLQMSLDIIGRAA